MIQFIKTEQVVAEQERQLSLYGLGEPGIISKATLESAVKSPMATFDGQYLYIGIFQMAAAYLVRLVKAHAFGNANKRTGLACALVFLKMNNVNIQASNEELVDLVIAAATGNGDLEPVERFFEERFVCDGAESKPDFETASGHIHERFAGAFATLADR